MHRHRNAIPKRIIIQYGHGEVQQYLNQPPMDGNPIWLQQGFGAGVEMVNQAFDRNEQELRKRKKVTRL